MGEIRNFIYLVELLIKKIIRYSIYVMLGYIVEMTLSVFGVLDFLKIEICSEYNSVQITIVLGITLTITAIVSMLIKQPTSILLYIKRNYKSFQVLGVIIEIVLLYKNVGTGIYIAVLDALLWYIVLDLIAYKFVSYINNYEMEMNKTLYYEKPILNNDWISKSQKETYDQLIAVIDSKNCKDSFNIGLMGAWGSGKSSVIYALINELETRKNGPTYFVLKLSVLEFNRIENIINYIKGFFDDLFSKYEVSVINDAGLLTSLAIMFEVKHSVKIKANSTSKNTYLNIDAERKVFTGQVQKLLNRSGRKNIILVIEDADRTSINSQVMNLLYEFSEVEGIIGIISLDNSNDVVIRPGLKSGQTIAGNNGILLEKTVYNELDKYIHLRIRMKDEKDISKESSITKLVLEQYHSLDNKKEAYLQLPQKYEAASLFSSNVGSTVVKNEIKRNDFDLLTTLFFMKLEHNGKSIGEYFDELVINYLFNTNEFLRRINEINLAEENGNLDDNLKIFYLSYIDKGFYEHFQLDWLDRLENLANNLWTYLRLIYLGIIYINSKMELRKNVAFGSLGDIYLYYVNKDNNTFSLDESNMGNNIVAPYVYLMFTNNEIKYIDNCISEKKYKEVEELIHQALEKVLILQMEVIPLKYFVNYLRQSENNYRFLKMQLREADLLNLNYLDYLIGEWNLQEDIYDELRNRLCTEGLFKPDEVNWVSVRTMIDTILYNNYILPYLKDIQKNEINTTRAYIYKGEKNYLCISEKELRVPLCINIIAGKHIELSREEYEKVLLYDDKVWERYKL